MTKVKSGLKPGGSPSEKTIQNHYFHMKRINYISIIFVDRISILHKV